MVYVTFVIDAFARRILGWRAATTMRTSLVLDALEMAIWACGRDGAADLAGLVHHNDAGSTPRSRSRPAGGGLSGHAASPLDAGLSRALSIASRLAMG